MQHRSKRICFWLALIAGIAIVAYSSIFESPPKIHSDRVMTSIYADGRFHNIHQSPELGFSDGMKALFRNMTEKSAMSEPDEPFNVVTLTVEDLQQAPNKSLWRLGHSTVLLKLDGKFWLTDPIFAERSAPFGLAAPKRFHQSPIALNELPPIEAVILSHDHYDHLDKETILALKEKAGVFVAPLGVGDRLINWGVPASKVRQLDWWEETKIDSLRLIATPAQHYSGRSPFDGDSTLWASWVLISPHERIFFSGDSGYFDGFKQIGKRFGPFNITLIENGAYNEAWADVHMQPEQTVQAHIDLQGEWLVPIHNGTFDLALHAWTEPMERVTTVAAQRGISVSTPRFGERIDISAPSHEYAWWREKSVSQIAYEKNSQICSHSEC